MRTQLSKIRTQQWWLGTKVSTLVMNHIVCMLLSDPQGHREADLCEQYDRHLVHHVLCDGVGGGAGAGCGAEKTFQCEAPTCQYEDEDIEDWKVTIMKATSAYIAVPREIHKYQCYLGEILGTDSQLAHKTKIKTQLSPAESEHAIMS